MLIKTTLSLLCRCGAAVLGALALAVTLSASPAPAQTGHRAVSYSTADRKFMAAYRRDISTHGADASVIRTGHAVCALARSTAPVLGRDEAYGRVLVHDAELAYCPELIW